MKFFAVLALATAASAQAIAPIMARQVPAPANTSVPPPPFPGAASGNLVTGASVFALTGAFAAGVALLA